MPASSAYLTSFNIIFTVFSSLEKFDNVIPFIIGVDFIFSASSSRPRMKATGRNGQPCRIPYSTLIGSDNQPLQLIQFSVFAVIIFTHLQNDSPNPKR